MAAASSSRARKALALAAVPALARPAHPIEAYFARLGPVSRRTGQEALLRAVRILSGGSVTDVHDLPWADVRYEHVLALRQALTDLHYAPATIQHTLVNVRGVLREAWRLGQLPSEVLLRIADVPPPRGRRSAQAGRLVSTDELRALVLACRRTGRARGARDLALLALLYGAGLRRAEACGLQLADLRPDGLRVLGKGSIERVQPLPPGARLWLRRWLQVRGRWAGPLLCPLHPAGVGTVLQRPLRPETVYWLLGDLARTAGVAPFSPHDLRRSYASHLLGRGVELRVVQQLMGHRQVTTTQRYDRRQFGQLAQLAGRLPLP